LLRKASAIRSERKLTVGRCYGQARINPALAGKLMKSCSFAAVKLILVKAPPRLVRKELIFIN
jgi:hypothetical protein